MSKNITKLGASGILCDVTENKVLLGLRAKDDPSLPGLWCTPGGGVEFQETINDCIVREFMEEVGLTVHVSENFLSLQECIHTTKHTLLIFKRVFYIAGHTQALDGFDDARWFGKQEIYEMFEKQLITSATEAALREFFSWASDNEGF